MLRRGVHLPPSAFEAWFASAAHTDEVLDRTGIRVPEGEVYDTVGGFVMSTLERIPNVGDSIELEDGTLEVQRMDGRRVDRVKFTPRPLPEGAEIEGGERR